MPAVTPGAHLGGQGFIVSYDVEVMVFKPDSEVSKDLVSKAEGAWLNREA